MQNTAPTLVTPVHVDERAVAHLPGVPLPELWLATTGAPVDLGALPGRAIVYVYPMTPRPGTEMPEHWSAVPGAVGCTEQVRGFGEAHEDLLAAGVQHVLGLSSQTLREQEESAARLRLDHHLAADPTLELHRVLRLPTFTLEGQTYYRRLTLVITDGVVEHVFYPVYPPEQHAAQVLTWLLSRGDAAVPVTTGPVPVVPTARIAPEPMPIVETLGARIRRAG